MGPTRSDILSSSFSSRESGLGHLGPFYNVLNAILMLCVRLTRMLVELVLRFLSLSCRNLRSLSCLKKGAQEPCIPQVPLQGIPQLLRSSVKDSLAPPPSSAEPYERFLL